MMSIVVVTVVIAYILLMMLSMALAITYCNKLCFVWKLSVVFLFSDVHLVSLEGLMGAGKSYLLNVIKQSDLMEYVTVCEEPVDQFSKFKTHNPLQLSYENPNRHAGFTQLHIIRVRANHYDKIRQDSKKVMLMEVVYTYVSSNTGYAFKLSLKW